MGGERAPKNKYLFWSEKIQDLSQESLQIFVAEQRKIASEIPVDGQVENINSFEQESWHTLSFPVAPDIEREMKFLKQKLEKENGITLTWNEVLKFLFSKKNLKKAEPVKVIQLCSDCVQRREAERVQVSRHIPEDVKRLVLARTKGNCAFLDCKYLAENFHHTRRFSLERSHDPRFIEALCKKHHGFLHSGLVENEESHPKFWTIRERVDEGSAKYRVDRLVAMHTIF